MRTIVEVTLKMTKDEMMKLLVDFLQQGKHQVKVPDGPVVNFVRENGTRTLDDPAEAAIEAAGRGGRVGEGGKGEEK